MRNLFLFLILSSSPIFADDLSTVLTILGDARKPTLASDIDAGARTFGYLNRRNLGRVISFSSAYFISANPEFVLTDFGKRYAADARKELGKKYGGDALDIAMDGCLSFCEKCYRDTGNTISVFVIGNEPLRIKEKAGEDGRILVRISKRFKSHQEANAFQIGHAVPISGRIVSINYSTRWIVEIVEIVVE